MEVDGRLSVLMDGGDGDVMATACEGADEPRNDDGRSAGFGGHGRDDVEDS